MSTHTPERTDDGKQPVWYRHHSTDTPDMHDLGELPPELDVAVKNSLVTLNAQEAVVDAARAFIHAEPSANPAEREAASNRLYAAVKHYERVTA